MLDSPLKKNKHSYPIDFSSKKKDLIKQSPKKYDKTNFNEQNPQLNFHSKKQSVALSNSSVSDLFLQSNKKPDTKNIFQFFLSHQNQHNSSIASSSRKQQNLFFQGDYNFQEVEQPLKQVKKKNNRIIVDENMLKNPRIQFNQDKTITGTDKTIETVTPQKTQKFHKPSIGGIKHQDFKYFEQFQSEKQFPLDPEKPFHLIGKEMKRKSFLQKLNLQKITQKSQGSQLQSYMNGQISIGHKVFRPETYTYVNKLISSQSQLQNEQKVRRVNSSFDSKKKQKIIYMNHDNIGNLSFNLPKLSLNNSGVKLNNKFSEQQNNLKSKFKQNSHSFFATNKSHFLNEQSNFLKNQPNEINKLKAQINLLAKNRFKDKEELEKAGSQTQRQFTFQNEQNKKSFAKPGQLKVISKKPTKKLQITYHVPLANLKRLCRIYLASPSVYYIAFKVPKIFMENNLFAKNQPKQLLHENALFLFQSLKINSKDMIIKRYSNCIMFICGHIVAMWYYNGKRYLGGWQYDYLDEGSRHGLGLQWEPNLYIYYGEFRNNKKHGLGAMKQGPDRITVGYWVNGKYIGTTFKQQNQTIQQSEGQNGEQQQENEQDQNQNEEYDFPE